MKQIQTFLSSIPHALFLALVVFAGAVYQYLVAMPATTVLGDVLTVSGAEALAKTLFGVGVVAVLAWMKVAPDLGGGAAGAPPEPDSTASLKRAVSAYPKGNGASLRVHMPPLHAYPFGAFAALMSVVCVLASASLVRCHNPAAVAPAITLAACVAEHAIEQESIAQIALACDADVPQVIAVLSQSVAPRVRDSVAFAEARMTLALAHSVDLDAGAE